MEGSSSNNDAGEPKSGCGCSGAAVDNNNDATAAAAAVAAKAARRAAALVAAKRASKTAAFIAKASAAQEQRHREYLSEQEQQQQKTTTTAQTDDRRQASAGGGDPADAVMGGDYDPERLRELFAAQVRSLRDELAAADAEKSEITITVSPTTGGQFDLSVLKTDSVESLKKVISKRLRVPKERICLLYRER